LILIARPTSIARWFASSASIRERELKSEQWGLFAPVQPGNEIKFAMFRRKPSLKQSEV